jgi:hypothetical protein
MNFIGYTYKADVEEQRSMLVNVLKDLGNMQDEVNSGQNSSQASSDYQRQQLNQV